MNTITGFFSSIFQTVSKGSSALGFLKPLGTSLLGMTLIAGALELFGVGISKKLLMQLMIIAAILGVILSVGPLVFHQKTVDNTQLNQSTSQTSLDAPIEISPDNPFVAPSPTSSSNPQNPCGVTMSCLPGGSIVLPATLGGLPVDGSIPAIGQQGTYGYSRAPSSTAGGQSQPLIVLSPEAPSSYSAQEINLKKAANAAADAAMFDMIATGR
jgi:hypothetical protein